jgi:hypothetical protein
MSSCALVMLCLLLFVIAADSSFIFSHFSDFVGERESVNVNDREIPGHFRLLEAFSDVYFY